ncbi:hypothetical protein [Cellvibrio sp. QJXJ]|uniref:hypothetical protein n=1 Tax=Cellvibrio sp. QJXJ TaxID=2964606 RepID=UPI0021C2ACC9|nr:hypothetical protein [Cellvibrio sp. QJXJ]UUA75283.1 hypothetical protein NNX04_22775 [Cellvibrio sp. QJXJ]
MQQQEVVTSTINPGLLLIDIADQIIKSKKKPIIKASFPVVTAKPVKNVSRLLEMEIVKGRSFSTMEEKWAFEEHLERGHK